MFNFHIVEFQIYVRKNPQNKKNPKAIPHAEKLIILNYIYIYILGI